MCGIAASLFWQLGGVLKSGPNGRRLCALLSVLIVSIALAPFVNWLYGTAKTAQALISRPLLTVGTGNNPHLADNVGESSLFTGGHIINEGLVVLSILQLALIVLIIIFARRHRRESQSLFAKAFRSSPLPITISTLAEGRFVNVNDAFVHMLGYPRKELIGRTATELGVWASNDDRSRLFDGLKSASTIPALQTRFKTITGDVREVSVSAECIELDGTDCVLAITQDVTDARRLENQLRQAQRMSAVGRMAGGVAHDFNNILTVIIGYSELAIHQMGARTDLSKYLLEIKRAGERAAALTRQLLAFSRQQVLYPRVLDLNAVLNNVTQMLLRVIGEDISLSFKPAVPLGYIKADPGQIEQILMNLVVNARDAMPDGGSITIETSGVTLDEGYLDSHWSVRPGRYVMLSVSDTGCGMDEKTMSHIFEPFFTTKMPGEGTGLGLSTVYGIVKQSGGYIWVYSEPEKGTTFKIYFPEFDPGMDKTQEPVLTAQPKGGSESILVVEDDAALRKLTTSVLGSMGYNVIEASDGEMALGLLRDPSMLIDLLLTDVLMPKMNGQELSIRIKEVKPAVKVLLMSGYAGELVSQRRNPEVALIQKPFTRHGLLSKVRAVLDEGKQDRSA
jgi:two-component system, cell cycle sensor histidine kinase and response regulator CckA